MTTFLSDIVLAGANDIQFKNTSGTNTGKISSDGDDLVLSNAVGDILFGDGASDVYIGDGTNSVDVLFEVSGSLSAESGATLTIGGAGGALSLLSPTLTTFDTSGTSTFSGPVNFGVNDTGHDIKFFGATSGAYMLWDESEDGLVITHPTDDAGLEIYTVSGSSPTTSQFKVGRDANQYFGVYTEDRTAHLIHRQDETDSGAMYTSSELWGGGSGNDSWTWKHGTNTGGSLATVMTLDKAGQLTITGEIEGGSLDINGNADISGNLTGVDTLTALNLVGTPANAGTHSLKLGRTDNSNYWYVNHAGNDFRLYNEAGSGSHILLGVDSSGNVEANNVGIGTATPDQKLHVVGNTQLSGTLTVGVDDTGHDVKFFGATSGSYMMWDESQNRLRLTDDAYLTLGDGDDIILFHNGSNSYLLNDTGDLYITNRANDKDIIFQSDDGAGGAATYFSLDGSAATHDGSATTGLHTIFPDNSSIGLGTGNDLRLYHQGSYSIIGNNTGDLYIQNNANDKDIILQSDDGSGGTTAYLTLDGGLGYMVAQKGVKHEDFLRLSDSKYLFVGNGNDLRIHHNGSDSYISQEGTGSLIIRTTTNDEDVIFQCDDGSGGTAEYFRLDGGAAIMAVSKEMRFADNVKLKLGNGPDSEFYHDGSNTYIANTTGNLYIDNGANDADIIFKGTDGGADITALTLDMSAAGKAVFNSSISIPDAGLAYFGTGNDLQINHDGSNSYINHVGTGHMYIQNTTDDKDIILRSDDGSGSVTPYLTLDGSAGHLTVQKEMNFANDVKATFGDYARLSIYHNGTDTFFDNTAGDMKFVNYADDKDIIFYSDDGSGGLAIYLTLDGSAGTVEVAKEMNLAVPLATDQQKHVMHYDFQGYATGDGTNYEMANNLSDTNAPFEHNISLGADGTTATTIQNIIRSGGKVMPRACTLTRWTGWAAAAGSATAYVALFKVTPTRNSNTDLSAVLLDEFSYTALGNAKMEDFDETSFTVTAIAAGDILITAMKSQSGAVHYFTSTVEVEF